MNTQRRPVQCFIFTSTDISYIGAPDLWVEITEKSVKSGRFAGLKQVLKVTIVSRDGCDEVTVIPDVDTPGDWSICENWPLTFKVTPNNPVSLEMGWVEASVASYIDRGIQFWGLKIK